jgi:ubiquitin-protein ligase
MTLINMKQDLSIISIGFLRNRIKREVDKLIKMNKCIDDDIKIFKENDIEYLIEFRNLDDNKYYKFLISNNYPFIPPKIFINEKSIMLNHEIKNLAFKISLKKYTGIECFCCETILCRNNWNPAFTFINVLNDINKFRDARRQIIVRIIIDVIKRKYLLADTNIIEWLY